MSESGFYQNLGASILGEQQAKAEAARLKAQTQHRERIESGKRAQQWWQDKMAPELQQASRELASMGILIKIETDARQINLGVFKGAMTIEKHSTKYFPHVFVIEDDEVKAYRDHSTVTPIGSYAMTPSAIDELCGSITDSAYPARVIRAIVETTLRGI